MFRDTLISLHIGTGACGSLFFRNRRSNQGAVGQDMNIAFSQPAINRSITAVAEAINASLLRRYVECPVTLEGRAAAKSEFKRALQPFIREIGAIYCTHVAIFRP